MGGSSPRASARRSKKGGGSPSVWSVAPKGSSSRLALKARWACSSKELPSGVCKRQPRPLGGQGGGLRLGRGEAVDKGLGLNAPAPADFPAPQRQDGSGVGVQGRPRCVCAA